MTDTDYADRLAQTATDNRTNQEAVQPPPLTADEFWARIDAPLR